MISKSRRWPKCLAEFVVRAHGRKHVEPGDVVSKLLEIVCWTQHLVRAELRHQDKQGRRERKRKRDEAGNPAPAKQLRESVPKVEH